MKDVKNTVNTTNGKYFITNSVGMGNLGAVSGVNDGYPDDSPAKTGCFYVNNIADLAGNVYEWTIESFNTIVRVHRGAYYISTGSSYTRVDARGNIYYPISSGDMVGSRLTLY